MLDMPVPRTDAFLARITPRLSASRLRHVLGVADHIAAFAPACGLSAEDAVTAALLHDACRAYDNETMLARAQEFGLPISAAQRAKPNLLHGPVAAEEARRELGIDHPGIYEAIYWHTTGRPGMGRLAQALYVADFSEPNRKYPEAAEARRILRDHGLDAALRYVAEQKAEHLAQKEVIEPATAEFLAWLRAR